MKKLFILFSGLLVIAVLVGGGYALFSMNTDIVVKDSLESVNSRYSGEFSFVDYSRKDNNENSRTLILNEKNTGDFKLVRYYTNSGKVHYNDNYLGYKNKDTIVSELESVVREIDKTAKLEVDLDKSTFPDGTVGSMSLIDLLEDENTVINVKILSLRKWDEDSVTNFSYASEARLHGKFKVDVLEWGSYIDFSNFDSTMKLPEAEGSRLHFMVGGRSVKYINRD